MGDLVKQCQQESRDLVKQCQQESQHLARRCQQKAHAPLKDLVHKIHVPEGLFQKLKEATKSLCEDRAKSKRTQRYSHSYESPKATSNRPSSGLPCSCCAKGRPLTMKFSNNLTDEAHADALRCLTE